MFGYLMPEKRELRIRELEDYKAHYCGVCHAICSANSRPLCSFLSYDATLIALIAGAYSTNEERCVMRCKVNPLRKVAFWKGEAGSYAADSNILYAYYKCRDDLADEKSFWGNVGERVLRKPAKKVIARRADMASATEKALCELLKLERDGCDDLDVSSMTWGRAMGSLFRYIPNAGKDAEALSFLGFYLGRWVYLMDAWDDLADDEKNGNYNVLLKKFSTSENVRAQRDRIEWILSALIEKAEQCAQLLKDDIRAPIWQNIIQRGTRVKMQEILFGIEKYSRKAMISAETGVENELSVQMGEIDESI